MSEVKIDRSGDMPDINYTPSRDTNDAIERLLSLAGIACEPGWSWDEVAWKIDAARERMEELYGRKPKEDTTKDREIMELRQRIENGRAAHTEDRVRLDTITRDRDRWRVAAEGALAVSEVIQEDMNRAIAQRDSATAELRMELEEVKRQLEVERDEIELKSACIAGMGKQAEKLAQENDEVKRQLWGAERRVVNLETERDTLKREVEGLRDLRSEETSLELAAAVIRWMSSIDPMAALPFGTREYSLAEAIHKTINQREK